MKTLIAQGAEAKLFLDGNTIIKDRIKKDYRIKEIDDRLRKSRTRREAKILDKLSALNFPGPKLIDCDKTEIIVMEKINGEMIRDILEKKDYIELSKEIGKKIAILHNNQIIHGDLTTSNMILESQKSKISGISKKNEIFFIDFGLSFFSHKVEDKAVDLHLLKQALESTHYTIWEKCFNAAIKAYEKESKEGKEVLKRLEQVETRGRYKRKNR